MFFLQRRAASATLSAFFGCAGQGVAKAVDVRRSPRAEDRIRCRTPAALVRARSLNVLEPTP